MKAHWITFPNEGVLVHCLTTWSISWPRWTGFIDPELACQIALYDDFISDASSKPRRIVENANAAFHQSE
jgi:hypothetical protein